MFKIKDNPKYPDDIETGRPGLMTESAKYGYADSIRLCDIDFEGMRKDKLESLEKNWAEIQDKVSIGDKNVYWMYGIKETDTKESYIKDHSSFSTYALLKNGEWFEKGQMGWWGVSTDEDENWQEEFDKLLKTLPGETLLTVVDCHI